MNKKREIEVLIFAVFLFSIILFSNFISAINTCPEGYQVAKGKSVTIKCYDSSCTAGSTVSYSGSASGLFVPTKTQAEWNAFKAVYSKISGTSYQCTCINTCSNLCEVVGCYSSRGGLFSYCGGIVTIHACVDPNCNPSTVKCCCE